jgi:DNA-binding transcriptional LysR family regulator
MDRFSTMATFVEVVKSESFTTAARSRGISRALVSRHIADLEKHLAVRLITRTTRSLKLTEAGRDYYQFCSRVLSEIGSEEQLISKRNKQVEGPVAIIAPKWIGNLDLAEAVVDFCSAHPRVSAELTLGGMNPKTYDFIEQGFDVAIHTRSIRNSRVKVKRIAVIRFVLCAAPSYLDRHRPPTQPKDLAEHNCLIQLTDPTWRFGRGKLGASVKVPRSFGSNSYMVLLTAALKGLGIALLPFRIARDDLQKGTLVELLKAHPIPDRPLYAAFAPGGAPEKVHALVSYLGDWFRKHPIST